MPEVKKDTALGKKRCKIERNRKNRKRGMVMVDTVFSPAFGNRPKCLVGS